MGKSSSFLFYVNLWSIGTKIERSMCLTILALNAHRPTPVNVLLEPIVYIADDWVHLWASIHILNDSYVEGNYKIEDMHKTDTVPHKTEHFVFE